MPQIVRTRKCIGRYNANLTKASLKLSETRILARTLLTSPSAAEWNKAIVADNILQKRNPATAKTLAAVLAQRLTTLDNSLIEAISNGESKEATAYVLAGTLKQSALLADFFDTILADLYRAFAQTIPQSSWAQFMDACESRDPSVTRWTPVVVRKLRQNVLRILAEANYITDTRTRKLNRVQIPKSVEESLRALGEHDLLRRLKVGEQ